MDMKTFSAKIGYDRKIHIPSSILKELNLKDGEIVSFFVEIENKINKTFGRLSKCKRKNRKDEFIVILRNNKIEVNKIARIKIMKFLKQRRIEIINKYFLYTTVIFNEAVNLNKNSTLVFYGKSNYQVLPFKIKLKDIALYMGCYFADGTKKGTYWRITASTFEQARFYIKMHKSLVKNYDLKFRISYSNKNNIKEDVIKNSLKHIWKDKVNIIVPKNRIKVLKTRSNNPRKWNKYGALDISNNGLGLLVYYNKILKMLIENIIKNNNKKLAIDFLCGVLEGDGTVNARKRGHIQIATNKSDLVILEKILKVAQIKYKSVIENNNKFYIRIGALEILNNFSELKDKIFNLYPKRRKALFDRFLNVGGIRFLVGEQKHASSWVKTYLRDINILDKKYKPTIHGKKIRDDLLRLNKMVTVK